MKLAAKTAHHVISVFLLTVLLAEGPGVVALFNLKLHGASITWLLFLQHRRQAGVGSEADVTTPSSGPPAC